MSASDPKPTNQKTDQKSDQDVQVPEFKEFQIEHPHIRAIVKAANQSNFSLFGGAVRDIIRGEMPKDLDFFLRHARMSDEIRDAIDVLTELLSGQYVFKFKSSPNTEYPDHHHDVCTYQIVSVDKKFTICADFIPSDICAKSLDADVNGLVYTGEEVYSTHAAMGNPDAAIQSCLRKQFEFLLQKHRNGKIKRQEHPGDCKTMADMRPIKIWINNDHRLAKLLNKGWLPADFVKHAAESVSAGMQASAIIKWLKPQLAQNNDGDTLLIPSSQKTCALCEEALPTYVHKLQCCQKQIHTSCSIEFVRARDKQLHLNCPLCAGDPFGWSTNTKIEDGLLNIKVEVDEPEITVTGDGTKQRIRPVIKSYYLPNNAPVGAQSVQLEYDVDVEQPGYWLVVQHGKGIICQRRAPSYYSCLVTTLNDRLRYEIYGRHYMNLLLKNLPDKRLNERQKAYMDIEPLNLDLNLSPDDYIYVVFVSSTINRPMVYNDLIHPPRREITYDNSGNVIIDTVYIPYALSVM